MPSRHGHRTLLNGKPRHTPEYDAWSNAISRCETESYPSYQHYGGRGIKMCPEWRRDFTAFLADMGFRPEGMTLDRINPDGDYEKSNCRWASMKDQVRNRRNVRQVTLNGERLCISDLRRIFKIGIRKALRMADQLDQEAHRAIS